jgi:hypothetical protein
LWIAHDVVRNKKLAKTNHRILLGMSITDVVSSVCTVLGRLPAPRHAKYYSGLGTTGTCTAQGFFYQSILSTVAYNAALAVYFLLVVKYKWKERAMRKVEIGMHIFAMSLFLITGLSLVALKMINPAFFLCFIDALPYHCHGMPDVPCVRGGNPDPYRWGFFYGPVWAMIFVVTIIMGMVYYTVLKQERRMDKFQFHATTNASSSSKQQVVIKGNGVTGGGRQRHNAVATQRKHSKNVATQGLWYLVPFYVTWLFPMLIHALSSAGVRGVNYKPLLVLTGIFMPLQGFMNMCVYLWPELSKWIKRKRRGAASSSNP